MVKLLVPAPFEVEFKADDRYSRHESVTVGDLQEAMRQLEAEPERAVFLGGGSRPLDRATFEAIKASFGSMSQGVLLVSVDGRLLWANDAARAENFCFEPVVGADVSSCFEGGTRHPFLKDLNLAISKRVIARAVVKMISGTFEVTLVPAGGADLAAAIFSRGGEAPLYERVERIAEAALELFPDDPEMLVRLPSAERVELIKGLVEKSVKRVFDYDDFVLRTIDLKSGELSVILARSSAGAKLSKRALHVSTTGGSVAGYVAATGKPYLVEDAEAEPRWIGDLEGIHSAVVVPLRLGGKVIGTFAIEKKERFAFDYYDLVLATIFAGYITASLDTADLVGLGQSVLVERVAESVVEEVAGHLKNISDSINQLRDLNIGDSIAVTSRLESIRASASTIEDAILKGARKVSAAVEAGVVEAEDVLSGKRVLVADDEPGILQSLGDILRSSGCEVEFAHDGSEAVEMSAEEKFDIVISDIKMPKMTGYEVYSSIKSRQPDTSVILMTAYGYDPTHSIVRARQEGLEAVLYKPFRAETLKKALRQALLKKEAER